MLLPPLATLLLAASPSGPAWTYDAIPATDLSELSVEATFDAASRLEVDARTSRFVRGVEEVNGEKARPLAGKGPWTPRGCKRGCKVRYRFQLRKAAEQLNDPDLAAAYGEVIESPPGAWLLRPTGAVPEGARYRLRVRSREEVRFATGLPAATALDTWEGPAASIGAAPYSALGPLRVLPRSACREEVRIAVAPGQRSISDQDLAEWAQSEARLACDYLGRFPVPGALVLVVAGDRGFGKTRGGGGATALVSVPGERRADELRRDGALLRELLRMALPTLPAKHNWLGEGLATYVEPVVRARAGLLPADKVWGDLLEGLPRGELRKTESGLDDAPRWGPATWGGALFWLKLDVEIRRRSGNERSVRNALRAVVAEGGGVAEEWPLDRLLAALDKGAGFLAAEPLYRAMGRRPARPELDALWRALGVRAGAGAGAATFDDGAKDAAIRQAITAP